MNLANAIAVGLKEIWAHKFRSVLTMMGIILGVAIFSAMRSANSSLGKSLSDTIGQIAGKAVLQVTAGQGGLPEEVVDKVRAVRGVNAAVPVIEAVVHTSDAMQGNILILGVDMAGDGSMRDYAIEGEDAVSDPLGFLAQPDSILVSQEFAARNNLSEGSSIAVRKVCFQGNHAFTDAELMAVMQTKYRRFLRGGELKDDDGDIEARPQGGVAFPIGCLHHVNFLLFCPCSNCHEKLVSGDDPS